jgi:hypothetical protein
MHTEVTPRPQIEGREPRFLGGSGTEPARASTAEPQPAQLVVAHPVDRRRINRERGVDARVTQDVDLLTEHLGKAFPCHKQVSVVYSSNKTAPVQAF